LVIDQTPNSDFLSGRIGLPLPVSEIASGKRQAGSARDLPGAQAALKAAA